MSNFIEIGPIAIDANNELISYLHETMPTQIFNPADFGSPADTIEEYVKSAVPFLIIVDEKTGLRSFDVPIFEMPDGSLGWYDYNEGAMMCSLHRCTLADGARGTVVKSLYMINTENWDDSPLPLSEIVELWAEAGSVVCWDADEQEWRMLEGEATVDSKWILPDQNSNLVSKPTLLKHQVVEAIEKILKLSDDAE